MELPAPRNNLYDRFMSGAVNPIFYKKIVKADAFTVSDACIGCRKCVQLCPLNNIRLDKDKPVWGGKLYALHGLYLLLPERSYRVWQKTRGETALSF